MHTNGMIDFALQVAATSARAIISNRIDAERDFFYGLSPLHKALVRASLWYAKHRGSIVNTALVEKLSALIEKLKETKGMKIFKRGFEKAIEMLDKCEEGGVFTWAPQLKRWLRDPDYIFWLGTVR